jgi:hypothetical protein
MGFTRQATPDEALAMTQEIAEICNKHGWNGVTNPKLLPRFIDEELKRLKKARKQLDKLRRKLDY